MNRIILGTRGSDLALAQTRIVAGQLGTAYPRLIVETRIIKTTGDARLDVSLFNPGPLDKGLFTKELEDALLRGEIHAAIHSLKDLPVEQPAGLCLSAILERADPADILISKHPGGLSGLPANAPVATSSLRRRSQVLHLRPDLVIQEIRGNVPTRINKLAASPDLQAIILAKAGLDRLGAGIVPPQLHVTRLEELLQAPGQGAIAVQSLASDTRSSEILRTLNHTATELCVTAERALLAGLGGGCHIPLGAAATVRDGKLHLRAVHFREDNHPWAIEMSWAVTSPLPDLAAVSWQPI